MRSGWGADTGYRIALRFYWHVACFFIDEHLLNLRVKSSDEDFNYVTGAFTSQAD